MDPSPAPPMVGGAFFMKGVSVRILVTGSRDWTDEAMIENEIATVLYEANVKHSCYVTLVVGGARGTDHLAQEFGKASGMHVEVHKAKWDKYGKAAGPLRNQEMVDSGADICLAFLNPGSKGARDCADRARKAGIEVREFYPRVMVTQEIGKEDK